MTAVAAYAGKENRPCAGKTCRKAATSRIDAATVAWAAAAASDADRWRRTGRRHRHRAGPCRLGARHRSGLLIGGAEVLTAPAADTGAPHRATHRRAPGRDGPLREQGARQHRNAMAAGLRQGWQVLPRAGPGPLSGHHPRPVRRGSAGRHGTVLLSGRPQGLSRHVVLRSDRDPLPGLRRRQQVLQFSRPMWSPTRSPIMCRT